MKKIFAYITGIAGIILLVTGILFNQKQSASIAVIGGADGPTSIFVAGKLGENVLLGFITAGVILLLGSIIYISKRKRDRKDENH